MFICLCFCCTDEGYYCKLGSHSPRPTPLANSSTDIIAQCPPYSSNEVGGICPEGTFCKAGSSEPQLCSPGMGEGMENVDGSALSALLTGLTPNVDYEASITASNCAGTSEPTAFSFGIQGTGGPEYQLLIVWGILDRGERRIIARVQ